MDSYKEIESKYRIMTEKPIRKTRHLDVRAKIKTIKVRNMNCNNINFKYD